MSTSMSISQFLVLLVSGLQGVQVVSGQGDRISGVLDQYPDRVAVGAEGDARSSGSSAGRSAPAAGSKALELRRFWRAIG